MKNTVIVSVLTTIVSGVILYFIEESLEKRRGVEHVNK